MFAWNVCEKYAATSLLYQSTKPKEKGYLLNLPKTFAEVLTEQFLQLWAQDLQKAGGRNNTSLTVRTIGPDTSPSPNLAEWFPAFIRMYTDYVHPWNSDSLILCLEIVFTYIHGVPRWMREPSSEGQ